MAYGSFNAGPGKAPDENVVRTDKLGVPGGVATLGADGKLSESQRPEENRYRYGQFCVTTDPTCPAEYYGGTWELVGMNRTLMGAGDGHMAGTTVEAGLPNISGYLHLYCAEVISRETPGSGLFKGTKASWGRTGWNSERDTGGVDLTVNASNVNPIYGNSDTVQPAGYYVYIWRRVPELKKISMPVLVSATAGIPYEAEAKLDCNDDTIAQRLTWEVSENQTGESVRLWVCDENPRKAVVETIPGNDDTTGGVASMKMLNLKVSADGVAAQTNLLYSIGAATVVGVCWDYSDTSTKLTRLTKDADPLKLVNMDITEEPVAAVGTNAGSSPFDAIAPWAGMEEYNIVNGTVAYRRGQSAAFSRKDYDAVVYIPKFWYKVVDDAENSKRYWYVSSRAKDGFELHPGSGRYVGKYQTNAGHTSVGNKAPLVSTNMSTFRTKAVAKGTGWYEYDYATRCAIELLYLVEYADFNASKLLGVSTKTGSTLTTGRTDSMSYHTGTVASALTENDSIQYRHIENFYGRLYELVDGVNVKAGVVWVSTNPANNDNTKTTNYTNIGTRVKSKGYQKLLGYSEIAPWAFFPSAVGATKDTGIAAYCWYNGYPNSVMSVAGYDSTVGCSPFIQTDDITSNSQDYITGRLMFVPTEETTAEASE